MTGLVNKMELKPKQHYKNCKSQPIEFFMHLKLPKTLSCDTGKLLVK